MCFLMSEDTHTRGQRGALSAKSLPAKTALATLLAMIAGSVVTLAAWAQDPPTGRPAAPGPVEFLGQDVDAETVLRGQELYAANCAACHGANLEGQPDWKRRLDNGRMPAPPHDASGHTWHHPDQDLLVIVRDGLSAIVPGYESDMPAFGGTLTDEEISAILAFVRSTWPEREREFQADVTRNAGSEDGS